MTGCPTVAMVLAAGLGRRRRESFPEISAQTAMFCHFPA